MTYISNANGNGYPYPPNHSPGDLGDSFEGSGIRGYFENYRGGHGTQSGPESRSRTRIELPSGAAMPYSGRGQDGGTAVRASSPAEDSRETDRLSSSYPRSEDGTAITGYAPSEAHLLPVESRMHVRGGGHGLGPSVTASDGYPYQKEETIYAPSYNNIKNSSHHGRGTTASTNPEKAPRNTNVASILVGYGTRHQLGFILTVLLQTVASSVMIGIVWSKYRNGTPKYYSQLSDYNAENLRRRSITVYLAIFLFGSAFEIVTALDALRLNNTIQLIGVCLFTVAMVVNYSIHPSYKDSN